MRNSLQCFFVQSSKFQMQAVKQQRTTTRARLFWDMFLGPVFSEGFLQRHYYSGDFNFLHGIRVGEASNPGPWHIQIRNIVSANIAIDNASFPATCTVWTETTAPKTVQERCAKRARSLSRFTTLSAAAPKTTAKNSTGKPEAMGTMIFTDIPSKDMSMQWDAATFRAARVADSLIQVGAVQVRTIVVYGYHSGISQSLRKNDVLLESVFSTASQFCIPTLVEGDLNCQIDFLPSWEAATRRGFQDMAVLQASAHNKNPDNTCRGISRLDCVLANPRAMQAFACLTVDPAGFTDHAVLTASFTWPTSISRVMQFSMPLDLDALPVQILLQSMIQCRDAIHLKDASLALTTFVNLFEAKVQRAFLNSTLRNLCSRHILVEDRRSFVSSNNYTLRYLNSWSLQLIGNCWQCESNA